MAAQYTLTKVTKTRPPISEETRAKLRARSLGKNNPFYGKKHTEETKFKLRAKVDRSKGANHFNWKGGHWNTLRRMALERDGYTCRICGLKEPEIMTVDHIVPKSVRPDLKSELSNLMTLCPNDHARKTMQDIKTGILTLGHKS